MICSVASNRDDRVDFQLQNNVLRKSVVVFVLLVAASCRAIDMNTFPLGVIIVPLKNEES